MKEILDFALTGHKNSAGLTIRKWICGLAILFFACHSEHVHSQDKQTSFPSAGNSATGTTDDGGNNSGSTAEATTATGLSGSLRIVRLLWQVKPAAAAKSLLRTIELALVRGQAEILVVQLAEMRNLLEKVIEKQGDPRLPAAIAAIVLSENAHQPIGNEKIQVLKSLVEGGVGLDERQILLRVWFQVATQDAFAYLRKLLVSERSDTLWLGQVVALAFDIDASKASELVLSDWNRLPRDVQVSAIEPLTQRAESMRMLNAAIRQGKIEKEMVNTNQLRKWLAASDQELIKEIETIWGQIRVTDNQQRQELVNRTISQLKSLSQPGDPYRGLMVFQKVCSQCHVLHGKGFEVGPNITSNGRGNFEQLVSNVLDPSLVIGTAFQSRTVLTSQGQVISGLLVAEDGKRLTLKLQGGKTIELDKQADIEQMRASASSLMPEGLEQQLSSTELADLFAMLCHVKPLDNPENELIPGTPERLIKAPQ